MTVTPITNNIHITNIINTIFITISSIIIITTAPLSPSQSPLSSSSSLPKLPRCTNACDCSKLSALLMLSCQEDGVVQVLFEPRSGVELRALALSVQGFQASSG